MVLDAGRGALARRAVPGVARVWGGTLLVAVMLGPAQVSAQSIPSAGEQLRDLQVQILEGPLCAGRLPLSKALLTSANLHDCMLALLDGLRGYQFVTASPPPPPPPGTGTAVIEWRIPLDQAPAPPLASARIE